MAEPNPTTVIADCIEKSKASADPELISDYIAEALRLLQIESSEDDAFKMLGSAKMDAVADDPTHTEALLELWPELEKQRELQSYSHPREDDLPPTRRDCPGTPGATFDRSRGRRSRHHTT